MAGRPADGEHDNILETKEWLETALELDRARRVAHQRGGSRAIQAVGLDHLDRSFHKVGMGSEREIVLAREVVPAEAASVAMGSLYFW